MNTPDLDWFSDGVAELAQGGTLSPRNAAMVRFCAACGGASDLAALPLTAADRQHLAGGDEVELAAGGTTFALRRRTTGGGDWLLARDAGAERRLATAVHAAERLRLLGTIGGGVVHDLANRVSVIVGFAEHLEDHLPDADRRLLAGLAAGAREAVALLRTLVLMLEQQPRGRNPVALSELARDAAHLLHKHGKGSGRAIELVPGADPVRVRVALADGLQAIAGAVLFALRSGGRGPLRIGVARAAAGRARASLRIDDEGDAAPYRQLAGALAHAGDGIVAAFAALPGGGMDLLQVAFLQRRLGGDLEASTDEDGRRSLLLRWPEARP